MKKINNVFESNSVPKDTLQYTFHYDSPMGEILIAADQIGLTGIWFEGQKYYALKLSPNHEEKKLPIFEETREWLDIYYKGEAPDFTPAIHLIGTDFQISVWKNLLKIPYGKTTTYGDISKMIARERGLKKCLHRLWAEQ